MWYYNEEDSDTSFDERGHCADQYISCRIWAAADRPGHDNVCKNDAKKEKLILLQKLLLIIIRFYKTKIHVKFKWTFKMRENR